MSNPTLQTPKGPSSQQPTQQRRRQRPKQTAPLQLAAGKLVLGPPVARAATAVLSANIPRAKPGDVVSMHWSSACEVLTRGELTRLQAATSTALATCNQTI
jgi:hypothetical protein